MPNLRDRPGLSPFQGVIFAIVMAFAVLSFAGVVAAAISGKLS
ncbi:MAG: hypothetical protein AB7O68_16885 [Pirellulales bacterium]